MSDLPNIHEILDAPNTSDGALIAALKRDATIDSPIEIFSSTPYTDEIFSNAPYTDPTTGLWYVDVTELSTGRTHRAAYFMPLVFHPIPADQQVTVTVHLDKPATME